MNPGRRDRDIGGFAIRVVVAIALVVLAAGLLWLNHVLLLLFAACLVAVILHAAADGLCRVLPMGKSFAIAVAGLLIVAVVGLIMAIFGQEVANQLEGLSNTLPAAWERFTAWVGEDRIQSALDSVSPGGSTVASLIRTVVGMTTASFTGLILAVLGGVYLAADPGGYRRGALLMLPAKARGRVGDALEATGHALRNWLFGQMFSMACTFVAVAIGMTVLGVPSALALALVAGLLEFIPLVGPFLGAIPALLIAMTVDMETALWTAGFFLLWQQIEGNALAPLVMRYAVSIPPAVTLFSIFIFGTIFGIVGIMLGGPLTVACWVMVKRLWVERAEEKT